MIFDIVVVSILIVSAAIAFFRGLIREVLTIIGVIGGLIAAYFLGPLLAPVARNMLGVNGEGDETKALFDLIPYTIVGDVLAYGAIFLIVVILLSVASHFLASGAKAVGLGALDRSLGVIFGLIRGILILALLYLPFYMFTELESRKDWLEGSRTRVYVEATAGWIEGLIPESLIEKSEEQAKEAQESIKSTREKLQEIDVLRGEETVKEKQPAQQKTFRPGEHENDPPLAGETENAPAYNEEERQIMQDLIRENMNENN